MKRMSFCAYAMLKQSNHAYWTGICEITYMLFQFDLHLPIKGIFPKLIYGIYKGTGFITPSVCFQILRNIQCYIDQQ